MPGLNLGNLSAANLIAGFIFGSIGFVAFIYGRRMHAWKPMFLGLALMVFPYFVEATAWVYTIGGLGTLSLFFLREKPLGPDLKCRTRRVFSARRPCRPALRRWRDR